MWTDHIEDNALEVDYELALRNIPTRSSPGCHAEHCVISYAASLFVHLMLAIFRAFKRSVAFSLVVVVFLFSHPIHIHADEARQECQGTEQGKPVTKAKTANCVGIVLGFKDVPSPYDAKELLRGLEIVNAVKIQDVNIRSDYKVLNSEMDSHLYVLYADHNTIKKNHFLNTIYTAASLVKFDAEDGFLLERLSKSYLEKEQQMCLLVLSADGDGRMYIGADEIDDDRQCFQTLFEKFMQTSINDVSTIIKEIHEGG